MTYKNTKTGFVFNSPCELKGADWVQVVSSPTPLIKEEKAEKKPVKKRTKKDD